MSRDIDLRDFSVDRATAARRAELRSLASDISDRLPEAHRIRIESFDATTGNPSVIASDSAPAETSDYVQRALDHVQAIGRAMGLEATQPTEFVPDPNVQQTSSHAVAVHLQQQYKGIPIFQATKTVRFAPDGTLEEAAGSSVTITRETDILPRFSVQQAVLKAAEHVATPHPDEQGATDQFGEPLNLASVDLTGFEPEVIATFPDKADRPTVLEAGPFGDRIKANLIWFPLDDELRLAWEVLITMPGYEGQYRTLVGAENGEILYSRQLVDFVAARMNVYHVDGGGARRMTDLPKALTDYGLPVPAGLPAGFPDP
jgi:extracellular elastinolytic metalloproteinase